MVTSDELDMRRRVWKILLRSDQTFAPVLDEAAAAGTSSEEGAENTREQGADDAGSDDNRDMDDLIQADIREQDSTSEP